VRLCGKGERQRVRLPVKDGNSLMAMAIQGVGGDVRGRAGEGTPEEACAGERLGELDAEELRPAGEAGGRCAGDGRVEAVAAPRAG
jgi:hypothetical protein